MTKPQVTYPKITRRRERRRATLKRAKHVLKERGWPRSQLHRVWKGLMKHWPEDPYSRDGLFDRLSRREAQEKKAIELTPAELRALRQQLGSPPSWWDRFRFWIQRLIQGLRR